MSHDLHHQYQYTLHLPPNTQLSINDAAMPSFANLVQAPLYTQLPSMSQPSRKRKRITNEEREEHTAKRIVSSQFNFGLLSHQDVTLRPASRVSIATLQHTYHLPNFLFDYQSSIYQAAYPMDEHTIVETWQSIRLTEDRRQLLSQPEWRRARAAPPRNLRDSASDPILYSKEPLDADSDVGGLGLDGESNVFLR